MPELRAPPRIEVEGGLGSKIRAFFLYKKTAWGQSGTYAAGGKVEFFSSAKKLHGGKQIHTQPEQPHMRSRNSRTRWGPTELYCAADAAALIITLVLGAPVASVAIIYKIATRPAHTPHTTTAGLVLAALHARRCRWSTTCSCTAAARSRSSRMSLRPRPLLLVPPRALRASVAPLRHLLAVLTRLRLKHAPHATLRLLLLPLGLLPLALKLRLLLLLLPLHASNLLAHLSNLRLQLGRLRIGHTCNGAMDPRKTWINFKLTWREHPVYFKIEHLNLIANMPPTLPENSKSILAQAPLPPSKLVQSEVE